MSVRNNAPTPPLPCGEGAGGEGRVEAPTFEVSRSGWAPAFGQTRQKDFVRANARAKRLRKEMTLSERELWNLLRSIDGYTFRRQPAVGNYVFDFACYAARLLIEIDGSIHRLPDVQANDRAKEIHAVANGFRILRFANNDVWDRPAWVVAQVRQVLCDGIVNSSERPSPPNPLSARERGSK